MTKRRKSSLIINSETIDREDISISYRVNGTDVPMSEKTKATLKLFFDLRKASTSMQEKEEFDAITALGGPGVLVNLETD